MCPQKKIPLSDRRPMAARRWCSWRCTGGAVTRPLASEFVCCFWRGANPCLVVFAFLREPFLVLAFCWGGHPLKGKPKESLEVFFFWGGTPFLCWVLRGNQTESYHFAEGPPKSVFRVFVRAISCGGTCTNCSFKGNKQ